MDNEVMVRETTLSPKEIGQQVQAIHDVMKQNMKDGVHFGIIPGCGDKPTLLKPGAEKLCMMFRLAPDFITETLFPGDEDKIGYRVTCRLNKVGSGDFWGSGVGECSSEEEKYKWRKAVCDKEFESADPVDRRTKYGKNKEGEVYTVQQIRTNPHDSANTILKMAKKRALVDAVLSVCAASDIFAQDLEDLPDEAKTKQTGKAVATNPNTWIHGTIDEYTPQSGKMPHRFTFGVEGGSVKVSEFSLPAGWDAQTIQTVMQGKERIVFQYVQKGKFKNLSKLILFSPDRQPEALEQEQQGDSIKNQQDEQADQEYQLQS